MTQASIVALLRDALKTALLLSAPFLIVSVGIGIIVSVFQAATQIHEQNIAFVFKIFAIAVMLALLGTWILSHGMDFVTRTFDAINALG